MRTLLLLLLLGGSAAPLVRAQSIALKTNLLYGTYTYTPNLSVEVGVGARSTLELGGGYNPWNLEGSYDNNKKAVHWLGQIEYRYWLCQKFSGHFFGAHILGTQFNISGHELPLLFGQGSESYRHEGYGYGGGFSYGYNFFVGKRWSVEATLGVGYARLHYDKYDCTKCGSAVGREAKNYFGPTRAGITLIYYIK